MSLAWMPFYVDSYLSDTRHLSTLEHGAYLLLIMRYWQKGSLPEDERMIARIAGMSPDQWEESRDVLAMLFGEGWTHARIDEELAKASEITNKRKGAAEAMHARRAAKAEQVHSTCSDTGVPPLPLQEPLPEEEPSSPPTEVRSPAPADDTSAAVEAYNAEAAAAGWPKVQRLTESRRRSLRQRLAECGGLPGWTAAMARARGSPFLTGDNDRRWKADFDFFLQTKSFTKLMEGAYDRRDQHHRQPGAGSRRTSGAGTLVSAMGDVLAERADAGSSASHPRPVCPDEGSAQGSAGNVLPLGRAFGAGFG